ATPPTLCSPLSLHDALPILMVRADGRTALYDAIASALVHLRNGTKQKKALVVLSDGGDNASQQSLASVLRLAESSLATIYTIGKIGEHTSELQSLAYLVCRL